MFKKRFSHRTCWLKLHYRQVICSGQWLRRRSWSAHSDEIVASPDHYRIGSFDHNVSRGLAVGRPCPRGSLA